MRLAVSRVWRLEVGTSPAEHGVYKGGNIYLAPTFRDEFWKVEAEKGEVLATFKMPGNVWGAPWVDNTGLYGASTGGHIVKFSLDGDILWKVDLYLSLGHFLSEAITEAWGKCIAVQFPKGIAVLDKNEGKVLWCDEWNPEQPQDGQEPTFDPETRLLWVCMPLKEKGLVAYDLNGKKCIIKDLPSPPPHYICPQIWSRFVLIVCKRHVTVFDRSSGKQVWVKGFSNVTYGGKNQDALEGGPRVITSDGKVIVWTADGTFYCMDITNGNILWTLDFKRLGYASIECNDLWGYAGGVAADGIFIILGRNNLPKSSDSPFTIDKNRLFIINYENGELVYVSEPVYQMACCCKPIVARSKVVIGSWYKDSKEQTYSNYYNCWKINVIDETRKVLDRDYLWLGGLHHGGYSTGCLLGYKKKSHLGI